MHKLSADQKRTLHVDAIVERLGQINRADKGDIPRVAEVFMRIVPGVQDKDPALKRIIAQPRPHLDKETPDSPLRNFFVLNKMLCTSDEKR